VYSCRVLTIVIADRPDGPGPDHAFNWPATTYLRFGLWQQVLQADLFTMPRAFPYQHALGFYALGIAQARTGNLTGAMVSHQQLQSIQATLTDRAATYCEVANYTLGAVVAQAQGNVAEALSTIKLAAAAQASWPYDEPPDFHLPIRQCQGQLELGQGDFEAAYTSFQADLDNYINNGWALWGLAETLKHLPLSPDRPSLASVQARLEQAWTRADVPLTSACLFLA
jgi:tetratricopeptide (TPR) repeat protein